MEVDGTRRRRSNYGIRGNRWSEGRMEDAGERVALILYTQMESERDQSSTISSHYVQ